MLEKSNIPGFYTKTAIILSLLLVALTIIFAKKYFKLYSMVSKLTEQTKVSRTAHIKTRKTPKSSIRKPDAAMSEILSHQRNAIKGLTKKNELIVAGWNKRFEDLLQKKEAEYDHTLKNILKDKEKKYNNFISESKEQINLLLELYAAKIKALKELVYENKLQTGDLLLFLQSYELALKTYGEALDTLDEAGFDEEKIKNISVVIHQQIATTLLLIHKSTVHNENGQQEEDSETREKDTDTNLMDPALEHLEIAIKLDNNNYRSYYLKAQVLNETGEKLPSIIDNLRQALSSKEIPYDQLLKDFDNLKNEPAFKELLPPAAKIE